MDNAEIAKLYDNGATSTILADTIGCSINKVLDVCREEGVEIRPKGRPKLKRSDQRNKEMIFDMLLPDSTLESVGQRYDISRERVRQIFKKVMDGGHTEYKKALINDKFRCIICGSPLFNKNGRLKTTYCSPRCFGISTKYDLKAERSCENCGKLFYPQRNWIAVKGKGKFCSILCNINYQHNKGKWNTDGSSSYKKLYKYYMSKKDPE